MLTGRPNKILLGPAVGLVAVCCVALSGCAVGAVPNAGTSPDPTYAPAELDPMADALGCSLADNATLDPIAFRGTTEREALDALASEADLQVTRWPGTAVPWVLGEEMTHEGAWLAFTSGGAGQGIVHVGQRVEAGSPNPEGEWIAYWEHLCQDVLDDAATGGGQGS